MDAPVGFAPQEAEAAAVAGGVRRRVDGCRRGAPAGAHSAAQPESGPGKSKHLDAKITNVLGLLATLTKDANKIFSHLTMCAVLVWQ